MAMIAGGAVVLAVGGVAMASIPNADGVIDGCYNSGSGALRVIDTSSEQCTFKETAISWNQQGQQGAQGLPGSQGSPGAAGAQGPAGPQGIPGAGDVTPMGSEAYLKCVGPVQGAFDGPVVEKGFEKSIAVEAAGHAIVSPRDAASGLPTGKRQHKPFTITKSVDKASPMFYKALTRNENLACTIKFIELGKDGTRVNYYTVKLTNALIASVQFRKGDARGGAGRLGEYEEIEFTYQKIEWTITDGAITAEDDWAAPAA